MLRPYSTFLTDLIYNTPDSEVNLGGSTPVFPFGDDHFEPLKLQTGPPRLIADYQRLLSATAKRMKVGEDQILFTPGSSQALIQVLSAITKPNNVVLIEDPQYEPFNSQSEFLGLDIKHFQRTGDEVKDHANMKAAGSAKVLLLTNAHAPLGGIYSKEFVLNLCKVYEWVLIDEDFYPLFTDGSITAIYGDEAPDNLITLHSFNKALGLLFIRLGFVRANPEVILNTDKMGTLFHIDVPAPSFQVGARAMENWDKIISAMFKNLEPNRKLILPLVKAHPDQFTHDFSSGFYNFLKVTPEFKNGNAFSEQMLKDTGIYVRPGELFKLPEHVRFHIFMPEPKMQDFVAYLQNKLF